MTTYEFWRHSSTREIWAVKLFDGVVVACSGPLHRDDVDPAFLEGLDYVEEGAGSIEKAREEYSPLIA